MEQNQSTNTTPIALQAEQAIGVESSSDWILKPDEHAKHLPKEAGPLKRILERADLQVTIDQYNTADEDAKKQQEIYKFWGSARIIFTLLASLIAATFLLPVDTFFGTGSKWLIIIAQYFFLMVVLIITRKLAWRRPFEKWMQNRGEAEIARVSLFDKVMKEEATPQEGELPLLPLKLEYFRRYQLDVQLNYYIGRGQEHAEHAGLTKRWSLVNDAFIILWGIIAIIAGLYYLDAQKTIELPAFLPKPDLTYMTQNLETWVLAIGLAISAFYSAQASNSLMNLDVRNAARYANVAKNLDFLKVSQLDEIRQAAATNDEERVLKFVEAIQNQISSEHKEWVILCPSFTEHSSKVQDAALTK